MFKDSYSNLLDLMEEDFLNKENRRFISPKMRKIIHSSQKHILEIVSFIFIIINNPSKLMTLILKMIHMSK